MCSLFLLVSKSLLWIALSFFLHYSPLSLALAALTTDAHSVLSKALVLHLFTPIFFKSGSTSSIHLNLGLSFFSQPFSFAIQIYILLLQLQYLEINFCYKFLGLFLFTSNHFYTLFLMFFSVFSFSTSLRLF